MTYFDESYNPTNAEEQEKLGNKYYYGNGVKQDYQKAIYWYLKAAEQGWDNAEFMLGVCYDYGYGVEEDKEKAVAWWTKAAFHGNSTALFNLGICYSNGNGVKINEEIAAFLYLQSAELGHNKAQFNLSNHYFHGIGIEQDYQKAIYWLTKSAEQGNLDAQNNLGTYYSIGSGVEKDDEIAVFWLTKAAEQGDSAAQNNLGVFYLNGGGIENDFEKGIYWLTKSVEQSNSDAQKNLGVCYANGQGVKKDENKAVYWYTKSAEQGNSNAQNNLGVCYQNGCGIKKDKEKAVYWYTKSAEQGNSSAQYNLGECYANGQGVKKDEEKAAYWFAKAAEQGNSDAQKKIDEYRVKKSAVFVAASLEKINNNIEAEKKTSSFDSQKSQNNPKNNESKINKNLIKCYNWTLIPEKYAIKEIDKSFEVYGGSGIPEKLLVFFKADQLLPSTTKDVSLLYNEKKLSAFLTASPLTLGRKRPTIQIRWNSSVRDLINSERRRLTANYIVFKPTSDENTYQIIFVKDFSAWIKQADVTNNIRQNSAPFKLRLNQEELEKAKADQKYTEERLKISSDDESDDSSDLIEENFQSIQDKLAPVSSSNIWDELVSQLDSNQIAYLRAVLDCKPAWELKSIIAKSGKMHDLFVDEINEVSNEIIGDLLIEDDDITECYREPLHHVLIR